MRRRTRISVLPLSLSFLIVKSIDNSTRCAQRILIVRCRTLIIRISKTLLASIQFDSSELNQIIRQFDPLSSFGVPHELSCSKVDNEKLRLKVKCRAFGTRQRTKSVQFSHTGIGMSLYLEFTGNSLPSFDCVIRSLNLEFFDSRYLSTISP